jgi:hypothetical protein
MVITLGYYPQNAVSLIARSAWHIAQRLVAPKANVQDLAGMHSFKAKLRAHERHRTYFACDVDPLVVDDGRGLGHAINYTPLGGGCRLVSHAG